MNQFVNKISEQKHFQPKIDDENGIIKIKSDSSDTGIEKDVANDILDNSVNDKMDDTVTVNLNKKHSKLLID